MSFPTPTSDSYPLRASQNLDQQPFDIEFQPQQYTNQSNQPPSNQPSGSACSYCVRRLILILVMLFLLLSCISFIAWQVINPSDPAFKLDILSVSNITLSDSKFTANYDLEFTVNNTNQKVDMFIDDVIVGVFFERAKISEGVLEQHVPVRKMSAESMKAVLERDSTLRVKNRVFQKLSDDWSQKMVNFDVVTNIRTRYEMDFWPSKERFMKVECMNLTVEFVSTKGTGKLWNKGKTCNLHWQ